MEGATMSGKITGKHVFWGLAAFFGVVFAVNGVFLTSAIKSFPGESEDKSYVQGIAYNDTLAQRRQQEELGWNAQIGLISDGDGASQNLIARIEDRSGAPVGALTVTAELLRHDGENHVVDLNLTDIGNGEFAAAFPDDSAGRWSVEINAAGPSGETFVATKDLYAK